MRTFALFQQHNLTTRSRKLKPDHAPGQTAAQDKCILAVHCLTRETQSRAGRNVSSFTSLSGTPAE